MRFPPLSLSLAVVGLAWSAPAQQIRALQVIDAFRLDYLMVHPHEEPRGWVDEEHYLVFESDPKADDGGAGWVRVSARTGERKPYFPNSSALDLFAGQAGFDAEQARAVALDGDAYEWSDDHGMATINTAHDLFVLHREASRLVRVTNTPEEEVGEQVSPDGRLVAYIADYNLHVVPTNGGTPRALTADGHEDLFYGRLDWVYQEELYGRGNFQGYWWSPDSTQIALLRLDEAPVEEFTLVSDTPFRPEVEVTNYPKTGEANPAVSIGVVPVRGGDITWFDLSRYGTQDLLVVRVTWAPDGKEVYFQVQEREQTWLDMLAGDPATGEVRLVFHEDSDCWVEARDEPFWIEDGEEFLWLSERSGYRHIHRYKKDGTYVGPLTKGEWEVKKLLRVEGGLLYYTCDRDDVKGVQLWRCALDGGDHERVTTTPGTHDVEMAPSGPLYLTTFSSAAIPHEIHVGDTTADAWVRTVAKSRTDMMAPYRIEPPEFHQIPARDGYVMEAMVLKPLGFKEGVRYPVVQFTYSGPHAPKVRDRWGGRDFLWHRMLNQKGYLVIVADNRSASGKGRVHAKACWRDMGSSELRDLEDALDWVVGKGWGDPQKTAIWGWSYGGYQTCFNLTHSKKWHVGIAVNPVTDWRLYDTIYTERYMGLPQTNPEGYARASVNEAAADLHGDLLLVAATMDDNVHMQNSLQFAHALQMAGKPFRFMPYPRVRHGIGSLEQQMHLFSMMTAFLDEKLGR